MRKRNLWKAAGIMAAGVLTVNMACGGTSSVYASETKIAASADRETQKEKSEKTESVTPVLLLDKDGKPVIGPDGKPVYVTPTPTPAKEAESKDAPDAPGAAPKADASGVLADEGQPESAEEASPADVTAAVQGEEINAVPVPIPEETESAAALPEAEAEPSAETVSEGGEEAYSEEPAEKNEEEPVTDGAAIEIGTEAPDASHAEENAAAESTGETASAENKAAGIPEATGPVNTESPSGRSEEKTASSEEAHSPADAGKGSSSDTFSDETEKGAREVSDEGAATDAEELKADVPVADASADISERTLPAEDISGETSDTVTVTSVRDLFATAVIPASTGYDAEEEEEYLSFFAALIGASANGAAGESTKETAEEEKDAAETASASSDGTEAAEPVSAASGNTAAEKDPSESREEPVVLEIEAVTEELAGPGTNQLVGNTDSVGTKTVTAGSTSSSSSGNTGSYSGSSSSSGSGSSGSSSGTTYQNTSPGATAVRTANPKTGDTRKARVYFGTAFASLAAIFKVMLETERAKKKIRK